MELWLIERIVDNALVGAKGSEVEEEEAFKVREVQ